MSKLQLSQENHEEKITLFVDLLLPVPISNYFTYRVPANLEEDLDLGKRVIVQFGSRRVLTGVIAEIHDKPPQDYEARYILDILDHEPSFNRYQLELFAWMARYYMCTPGEVLQAAIPSGLKMSSESKIQLNPTFEMASSEYPFTEPELSLIEALRNNDNISYNDVPTIVGLKTIHPVVKSLVRKEVVILFDELLERYKPKQEKRIKLSSDYTSEASLEILFEVLQKKPKQTDVLLFYLQNVPVHTDPKQNDVGIKKAEFKKAGLSTSSLATLIKNGMLLEYEVVVDRFPGIDSVLPLPKLSKAQLDSQSKILEGFDLGKSVLLHGITGSGKTEIYVHLIHEAIESGHQVLYLLPEIALTTQIVSRLTKVFGDQMGVYHSRFSDNERVEIWTGLIQDRFKFIVGVRSSIFLPFDNLGLIIIDEEHEQSFKQAEPAPRYHARDSALMLARMHKSKVLLGSATPSLEIFHQTKANNIHLVNLSERYGESDLPKINFSDIGIERQKKRMKGDFSSTLIAAIEKTLQNNHQTIIFQNRRGYAPYLHCETCGWIPQCENCSVSLTYHLFRNELKCHYCGFRQASPGNCHTCNSTHLETKNYGTEKLEEDLKLMFPDKNVARMDYDTTRKKYGYQSIIEEFESGHIDILVGTQMVSKGLDFENVDLVGIFDADRMLHFPDFRAHERAFQLLTQVSGRAGRKDASGEVIVQTYAPTDPILQLVKDQDYEKFFSREITEREKYKYPPFYRLINISLKHKDNSVCYEAAKELARLLQEQFGGKRVSNPHEGFIAKIRNQFIWEILVKLERQGVNLTKSKEHMLTMGRTIKDNKNFRGINIIFDVDP